MSRPVHIDTPKGLYQVTSRGLERRATVHDAAGRLSALGNRKTDGTAITTFAFTRDPNGNILTSAREDGSCWYYQYDGMQRLTGAEWKDGATLLYGYQYNYDKVGNRMSMIINGETACCYSYNNCNELTDELSGSEEVDYAYDGRGNCIRRTVEDGATTYFDYNARNLITRIDSDDPGFPPHVFTYSTLGDRIRVATIRCVRGSRLARPRSALRVGYRCSGKGEAGACRLLCLQVATLVA